MGTLTANQPRLQEYCEHKLPTSCRLSSIPQCCACADERAHAPSYSTYIDGIGFVPRGNRWQRYCWFCKEFWENRVQASGLLPRQTRIPAVPDQSEFLERWYEFHQGYRIIPTHDGREEREAVLGEDLRDVAPGCLPRTLEELRAGRQQSELAEREARLRAENSLQQQPDAVPAGLSLEDELEQLFQAADSEDLGGQRVAAAAATAAAEAASQTPAEPPPPASSVNMFGQAMDPTRAPDFEFRARRVAALRRELHRMRRGMERVVSGLRSFGEEVPGPAEASRSLNELEHTIEGMSGPSLGDQADRMLVIVNRLASSVPEVPQRDRTLADMQARVEEARELVAAKRIVRDAVAQRLNELEEELRTSQARLRQLQNEQRTTENYMRLFGSREEMIAQGDNYESPIGGMFNRAWERYQAVEEVRREEQTLRQVLEDEELITGPGGADIIRRLNELGARERDVWGVPRASQPGGMPAGPTGIADMSQLLDREHGDVPQPEFGDPDILGEYHGLLQDQIPRADIYDPRAGSMAIPTELLTGDTISPGDAPNVAAPSYIVGGPPGEQLDQDPVTNNDRGLDAMHILGRLSNDDTLQDHLPNDLAASQLVRLILAVEGNSLEAGDVLYLEALLDNLELVWASGLPEERIRRRRQRGEEVTFSEDAHTWAIESVVIIHDVEIMAECFQMSASIRRRSGILAPAQLRMLYRLQRGERNAGDREVLSRMLQDEETIALAKDAQVQTLGQQSGLESMQQANLERSRREDARSGDHSRTELDAQRRATRAFALAAGRVAMQAGPSTLYQRMTDRFEGRNGPYGRTVQANEDGTRATPYRRLNLDDFMASPSATDSASGSEVDEEARGLDAADTGRPAEPKSDEEMTVKLDCRICYSQLADIACLPCGHLVMCKWCSEQHSPVMAHDRTRPRRPAGCPVCRKGIKQKVRVFRA